MSVGNITAAWAAARVENSMALCQLNFDFTFKKVLPPVEYQPVGKALTLQRRANAEEGSAHRLARKLGWLFEGIIPDTPKLLRSYGLRVSEILKEPGINPSGTPADGCFQDFVGADCTSLWAAATSGVPALGVHLLSCMLARAWDAKTATAIWVELVEERQTEIINSIRKDLVVPETSLIAAKQEFSRQELANLDASARAWLTRADHTHMKQRDQFLLIAKNVSVSTGSNRKPYPNVIDAWKSAMQCLENHFSGISQQVSSGGVLYAISAWHLFPDLVHFSAKVQNVRFHDHLFTKPATITLGLDEFEASDLNSGVHWSLSLSHLRYYGKSCDVEAEEDRSRVDIVRFLVVVLGSVLESWKIPPAKQLDAIRWIYGFWQYLEKAHQNKQSSSVLPGATTWLVPLARAAGCVLAWPAHDADGYKDLLQHGERWAQSFLLDAEYRFSVGQPYFGLCNPCVISALQQPSDIDAGIDVLRQAAVGMGLKEGEALICYSRYGSETKYWEYCTAIPHLVPDGTGGCFSSHARWIRTEVGVQNNLDIQARTKVIKDQGEYCYELQKPSPIIQRSVYQDTRKFESGVDANDLIWEQPPVVFSEHGKPCECTYHAKETAFSCFMLSSAAITSTGKRSRYPYASFRRHNDATAHRHNGFELYVKTDIQRKYNGKIYEDLFSQKLMNPLESLRIIQQDKLCRELLWNYFQCFAKFEEFFTETVRLLTDEAGPPRKWFQSLEILGAISSIYDGLESATISLRTVEYPLLEATWTRGLTVQRGTANILQRMDRPTTFSCIVMLHTGGTDLQPDDLEQVMAMSSDNSIYVAGSLLTDPRQAVKGTDVRHIIGNVGYAGFNLMVAPPGDLIVNQPKNELRVIRRDTYDFKREDSFQRTSLHLKFTQHRFPLLSASSDTIDQDIFHLQSVVQLWDNGQYIADLDLLKIEGLQVDRLVLDCHCEEPMVEYGEEDIRSLDSWNEVLCPPRRVCVVRAHRNWPARLAATVLLSQLERTHTISILGPEKLCWKCLVELYQYPEQHLPELLID